MEFLSWGHKGRGWGQVGTYAYPLSHIDRSPVRCRARTFNRTLKCTSESVHLS